MELNLVEGEYLIYSKVYWFDMVFEYIINTYSQFEVSLKTFNGNIEQIHNFVINTAIFFFKYL